MFLSSCAEILHLDQGETELILEQGSSLRILVMKSLLAILSHQAHILPIDYGQTIRLTNQANDRVANVFSSKSTTAGSILALASYMT